MNARCLIQAAKLFHLLAGKNSFLLITRNDSANSTTRDVSTHHGTITDLGRGLKAKQKKYKCSKRVENTSYAVAHCTVPLLVVLR